MSRFQNLFVFILGAITGSIGTILIVPETGTSTRSKLSFTINRYFQELRAYIDSLFIEDASIESNAKRAGDAVLQKAKTQAEALLEDVDHLIARIKKR